MRASAKANSAARRDTSVPFTGTRMLRRERSGPSCSAPRATTTASGPANECATSTMPPWKPPASARAGFSPTMRKS